MIPDCIDNEVAKSYGKKAVVYDTELCKSYVDFCGTNIQNGAAVGRVASLFEAKKNKGISICLDDDYAGIAASKPINTYKKEALVFYRRSYSLYPQNYEVKVLIDQLSK